MTDEIILGNGDSRYLKSVSDFLTRYPTYEDMVAALVAGTLPIDLNGKNSAGIAQAGTPLNKANLLADATATAAGLTSTATPNTVLLNLAKLYPVINNKTAITYTSLATGDKLPLADVSAGTAKTVTLANLLSWFTTTNKVARIQTGSYVGTGTYGEDNPCSITFDFAPVLVFGTKYVYGKKSSDGKTLNWYISGTDANADDQVNTSDKTYNWVAIG